MRARDIEQVGSLLRGQFGMDRHDLYGVTFGQFPQNVHQQAQRRGRQFDRMRLVALVKNLDVLGGRIIRQLRRQGALALHGGVSLVLGGECGRKHGWHRGTCCGQSNATRIIEIVEKCNKRNTQDALIPVL